MLTAVSTRKECAPMLDKPKSPFVEPTLNEEASLADVTLSSSGGSPTGNPV
jgi:hypothetical protein